MCIKRMNHELIDIAKHGRIDDLDEIFNRHKANCQSYTWFLWDRIDLSYTNSDGMTAMKWPVLNNDINTLEKLLSLAHSNKLLVELGVRQSLSEALFTACKNDNPAIAKLLLEYGADPNIIVEEDSALSISFRPQYVTSVDIKDFSEDVYQINGNAIELVKLLLHYRADPELILPSGRDAISISRNWKGWKNLEITSILSSTSN